MSKQQLKGLLEKLNKQIDQKIIKGQDYKKLAKEHKQLIKIINHY